MHKLKKRYSVHSLIVLIILVFAFNMRVLLLTLGWPPLDSDQAYIGLMGMHIAFNHDLPIFFYGQGYMGAFEAYIAALLFSIFGSSTFILQLGVSLLFLGFLITMYFLTRRLYGKKLAVLTIIFLSLGSNVKLTHEMIALAGYTETLLFGSLVMLIASYLAMTSHGAKKLQIRRLSLFAVWGLISGIGLWTNLLVAPFVLISGILILIFCFKELFGVASIVLLTFLFIGLLPVIIYNKDAPPGQDTFTFINKVHSAHGIEPPPISDRLNGALQIAIPHTTGAIFLCTHAQQQTVNYNNTFCVLPHILWPAGFVTLWFLAFALLVKDFWKTVKKQITHTEKRKQIILISCRISLLITGLLVFLFYTASPNAALYPIPSSRYLIGLFVSLPAILWPLLINKAGKAIIIFLGVIYTLGTIYIFFGSPNQRNYVQQSGLSALQVADQQLDVPEVRRITQQQYGLINSLFSLGIYTIYSDYWTCARLMFQTKEKIYCSAVTDDFRHGHNRYPLYAETVKNNPKAAYVFPTGSPQTTIFLSLNSSSKPAPYKLIPINGYDIYIPQSK